MSSNITPSTTAGRGRGKTSPSAGKGRGRGYGIDSSPLRKPDSRDSSRPGSGTNSPARVSSSSQSVPKATVSDTTVTTKTGNSQLNAQAKEFVFVTTAKSRSDTSTTVTLSATAAEFVPTQTPMMQSINHYDQLVGFLSYVLDQQLNDPGLYDSSMPDVTSYLSKNLIDITAMETACRVIFDWALTVENFSYTCARMCQHIAQSVLNDHNGGFPSHMLKRCHEEHKQMSHLMTNNPTRACAFAIFLAELYSKDKFRVPHVMKALLEIVERMMNILNNEFARTVGQLMKMCGAHLEDDLEKSGDVKQMDTLICTIRAKVAGASGYK